jgi:hypothetical protein
MSHSKKVQQVPLLPVAITHCQCSQHVPNALVVTARVDGDPLLLLRRHARWVRGCGSTAGFAAAATATGLALAVEADHDASNDALVRAAASVYKHNHQTHVHFLLVVVPVIPCLDSGHCHGLCMVN